MVYTCKMKSLQIDHIIIIWMSFNIRMPNRARSWLSIARGALLKNLAKEAAPPPKHPQLPAWREILIGCILEKKKSFEIIE